MKLIISGPPGSGKGTRAKLISKKLEIPHISTGDLFRKEISEGTELGRTAKQLMDKGQLVPDEITINMLKNRLLQEDCKKGFILDGVPRTIKQAEMLKDVTDVDMFLNLIVRDHILVERMTTRRTCKSCGAIFNVKNSPPKIEGKCDHCSSELIQRDDEKPAVIQDRLKVYETNTKPLINFYKELELLEELDAEADAYDQKIQKEMFRILGVED